MNKLKNLKEWKTTLIGLVCYAVSFYYLIEVENHNMYVFTILLVFATMMLFSADSLVGSLTKFLKNNEDKKI